MTSEENIFIPPTQLITLEPHMRDMLSFLNESGCKPLIIGGAVRDALLGIQPKDIDIEVYNISYTELENILSQNGHVDLVGKSFGIIKFKHDKDYVDGNNMIYDFSVPRKENKIGIGHKDFKVTFDTTMTIKEAGERRDFTWNALAYDPLENKVYDYFGGLADLKNGIIRHTSDNFKEDSLRILRALQFQSRFNFSIHPDTISEIKNMLAGDDFQSLPKERIFEEFRKWAEKGTAHHLIFPFLRDTGLIEHYPELKALKDCQQDAIYHPEGDVETHTILCLKQMDKILIRENITGEEKLILIMVILLHDVAKPATTKELMKNGRMTITSHGHEALGASMAKDFLARLGFHDDLIKPICNLIADHLAGVAITSIDEKKGRMKAVKKLSRRLHPATIQQLTYVMEADHNGRGSDTHTEPTGKAELLSLAKEIDVEKKPYEYILMGRHLIEAGLEPSNTFGVILRKAEEAQLNGEFQDLDGAKQWLKQNHINQSGLKTT